MAINYKKCPKCGSLNVIRIIYGMPTHEAAQMAEEGKVRLGGCCITDSDPEYFCKDCENEWDKQMSIDSAYGEISGIRASVGGYFDGYYEIEMDFLSKEVRWAHSGIAEEISSIKTISESAVESCLENLKALYILDWKREYIEPDICDGTQWSIEIIRKGRNIKKHGSNMYPSNWKQFCHLMKDISGKKFS